MILFSINDREVRGFLIATRWFNNYLLTINIFVANDLYDRRLFTGLLQLYHRDILFLRSGNRYT
jgi:hypothetical protein